MPARLIHCLITKKSSHGKKQKFPWEKAKVPMGKSKSFHGNFFSREASVG
jgi:hypothetical protein